MSDNKVKPERTGHRDMTLNLLYRNLNNKCYALDVDLAGYIFVNERPYPFIFYEAKMMENIHAPLNYSNASIKAFIEIVRYTHRSLAFENINYVPIGVFLKYSESLVSTYDTTQIENSDTFRVCTEFIYFQDKYATGNFVKGSAVTITGSKNFIDSWSDFLDKQKSYIRTAIKNSNRGV